MYVTYHFNDYRSNRCYRLDHLHAVKKTKIPDATKAFGIFYFVLIAVPPQNEVSLYPGASIR